MSEFAGLAEDLRARGFGVTFALRIQDPGRRKIPVIKTVRELTGWGLRDAKHSVERCATIIAGVDAEQAEQAAAKLRDAGATVEVGFSELFLYGFDPNDPRRGDQAIDRLRVVDLGLAIEHGRLGAWKPGLALPRTTKELLASIDEQLRDWARAGKQQATTELEILEQLSARELALEARLRNSEGEARQREAAVYGDWLQTQGDPRGLIAAVASANERSELERLVEQHASHLFGPSRELLAAAEWSWCGPILDTLVLHIPDSQARPLPPPAPERVAELLALPACACLRTLAIKRAIDGDFGLGEILAEAACASGLRELQIERSPGVTLSGDAWEQLTRLTLHGRFTLGPAKLPALRSLDAELEVPLAPLAASFSGLEAPALEHFGITVRAHDYWDQNYGPMQSALFELLSQPSFSRLRSLAIAAGPLFVGFAGLLARIPAIATLERIDLRAAQMNDACRAELERSRDRLPGLLMRH
ncbi:MAG: ribosomal protein L7/L12 [Enhygromyxa sp.]